MPICTGGSEPKDGVPTTIALVGEGIAALIGLRFPWLGMIAGFVSPMLISVDDLCSIDPPAIPTWTADDIIALLAPGVTPATITATGKLTDTIKNVAWYQFCECSAMATPTEPSPSAAPSDLPLVNPFPSDLPTGVSGYVAEVMADSPNQYWRFAESGGVLAHSIAGTPKRPWSIGSGALPPFGFTGPVSDGGSMVMTGGLARHFGTDRFADAPWTFEVWLWFSTHWATAPGDSRFIRFGNAANFEMYYGSSGITVNVNTPYAGFSITDPGFTWRHIVATKSGSSFLIYADGALVATLSSTGGAFLEGLAELLNATYGIAFAEMAIYPTALSSTRIAAHYAAADRKSFRPAWRGSQLVQPSGLTDASATLEQLRELVTLIQRQEVPFGFLDGTVHTGLTASGLLTVSGLLGIRVDLTTIPAHIGRIDGQPTVYFDVGYIALGTATGFQRREIIRHDPQYVFSGEAGLYTRVAYTFPPGVVATITELLREP